MFKGHTKKLLPGPWTPLTIFFCISFIDMKILILLINIQYTWPKYCATITRQACKCIFYPRNEISDQNYNYLDP